MQCRFISDLHLYDVYSIGWRDAIGSLEDYANLLIHNWNEFTKPDDLVFIVGDIGYFCPKTVETLKQLNGIKILVIGNHDIVWHDNIYTCGVFRGIHTELNSKGIHIEHLPYRERKGAQFYVHGHHHRYDMSGMNKHLQKYAQDTCRLNCASDVIGHKPRTLQELIICKEVLLDTCRTNNLL